MKLFDDFLEASSKIADQAVKVAGEAFEQSKSLAEEAVDKGKKKVNQLALENDLAKAQRQLGALVYVMHKTGEQNDELLAQYIDDVAKIESELENLKSELVNSQEDYSIEDENCDECAHETRVCPQCGAEVAEDDIYCRGCGEKLN